MSHPRSFNFCALGLVLSRVMARTAKLLEEWFRMAFITEPPWAPVAPIMAMIFLSDMAVAVVVLVVVSVVLVK